MAVDPMEGLSSFFRAGDMNDPRVNQALRQRLAYALLAGKKGYPKNIGEGLTAIGDAIGDRGLAKALEQSDIAAQGVQPPPPIADERAAPSRVSDVSYDETPAPTEAPVRMASLPPAAAALPPEPPPPPPAVLPSPRELAQPPAAPPTPRIMQPGQVTMNVDMPQKAPIVMDPAAEGGMEVGTVTPTKMNVAQAYMNPGGSQSRGVASVNQAFGQPDPATVSGPNFPGREELAKALLMRQQAMQPPATAQGVPQPNPTLPGALPPSSTIPSPENLKPDQRLAQDTSRSMSDIGAAPQVQQIRKAPAVGQPPEAVPGYVPPEPGQVPGAPLVRMTPREVQLQQWLAANQGNPYAAMKVAPELQSLQAERTQRQNEANERFKASITQQTKQMEMRQQALVDQAKRITDVEHTQHQTAAGRLIDPYDKQYVLGPDGVARPLKVEGQNSKEMPQVKLTEVQQKALVFHDWARLGNEGMDGKEALLAKGLQQELLGKVPFAGNSLQSAEYRRARNAANNFVLAFMRDTSGAAYGAKEMYDHASALLPKFGDDAGTLADKAKQREAFVNNLYGSMGSARQIADWSIKQQKEKEQTKQYAIDSEMKDVMPKGIGDTKTNIKTGVRRVWNGKNWLEM